MARMSPRRVHASVVGAGLAAVLVASWPPTHAVQAQAANEDAVARLEASVQAAEAVRAVKRVQLAYGHFLDSGMWQDAADLFTDTAVARFSSVVTVTGRENVRRHLMQAAGRTAPGLADGQLHTHLMLQPIVTLGADGRSAKATWHEVAMLGHFQKSASWKGGIYENEYVLEGDAWKISRLGYYEQYRGEYDEYGHKAPPSWGVPYHFEAAHVGVTIPASARRARQTIGGGTGEARLARAAGRIQRLHDETAVQNLQHSYGYYLDRKLWDDVADLFADGATFEIGQSGVYVGRDRIRRALEALYGAPGLRHGELFDHIIMGAVVTVSGDGTRAAVRANELGQIGLLGEFARWELGTYENAFVKENGVWKIAALRYFPHMATDYDQGWGRHVAASLSVSTTLPPDRKPSHAYRPYPRTDYLGFSFAHPVGGRGVRMPSGTVIAVERPQTGSSAAPGGLSLAELERRVDAAIAVDAVENLNSSYGYYIDESAWDQMADTYSETKGAKEITGAGVYVGRERIRTVLNLRGPRGGRTANFFTIHQLTQPVIHISEDGQSAKARLRLFQSGGNADGSSGSWIGGIYENTAVFENGEWKFGVQDLHHIFNASYRNGWSRVGAAARAGGAGRAGAPGGGAPPAATGRAAGAPATGRGGAPPAGAAGAAPAGGRAGRDVPGGGITQGLGGARQPAQFVKDFPPDRPIRSRQYAFPEIVEPAFHYRNPVSGRMPKELLP